jgi:hypothetical protein
LWIRSVHTRGAGFGSCPGSSAAGPRERVLFIGTQFSILYTFMYSPAEAATQEWKDFKTQPVLVQITAHRELSSEPQSCI